MPRRGTALRHYWPLLASDGWGSFGQASLANTRFQCYLRFEFEFSCAFVISTVFSNHANIRSLLKRF